MTIVIYIAMTNTINNIENVWAVWTRRLSFFVFGLITSSWTLQLYNTRFKAIENLDWVMFQDTARLLLESRVRDIYPGITENLPFFYPPYFIPLIAPLGLLSRSWGYTSIVLSMIAAMAVALWILRRALPWNGPGYATGVLVVLSSASWNEMVILGHLGALYLLVLVSGLLLWIRHRRFLAGAIEPHDAQA